MGKLNLQQQKLLDYGTNILKPRSKLTGTEYMDKYFYLSPESSAIPGKWKTRPWQKDIINAMTDQTTQTVVIKKPTRVGFSLILSGVTSYYIHQRPSVQLHYQPNADEAKGYAETSIETMIRDNKVIRDLVEAPNIRGRTKKEKTIRKNYPGGYAEFLGAESDRNFNRRTARLVTGDEVDTWKKEAGNAGDTITTMFRRTSDFWDRKNIIGGKPIGNEYDSEKADKLTSGVSVIDFWYKKGTQEQRHLPCPHCEHFQILDFENMKWDKDKNEKGETIKHYPETVHFVCENCGKKILDRHKRAMDKKGKWIAGNPDALKQNLRSFHLWAVLSYSPNVTWAHIVQEFLDAKDNRLKLKAFYNEVLARTFEENYEKIEIDDYESRKEVYTSQVPDGVLVLTFGADTQDDRIECEIIGWGEAEESWSIAYKIFHGDTSKPEVWKRFDEFLMRSWTRNNGGTMKVFCGGIDTQGHRAKQAYAFCKSRFSRRIFAFKGAKAIDAPISPRIASRNNKVNVPLFMIGVNTAKDVIYSHITTETIGPGYMHFPQDTEYNAEYFKQLTAEQRGKDGRWVKHRARNEALDVRVYGYASLLVAGVDLEVLAHHGPIIFSEKTEIKRNVKKIKQPTSYLEEY